MKAAIHQPHYFPWVGYFDKMAKADLFVLLDEVQLVKSSCMIRNRVLDAEGQIKYLTISGDKKDFLNRQYCDIPTKDIAIWTSRQMNALKNYYRRASAAREVFPLLESFFQCAYPTVCQWTCASIQMVRELLDIETPLVYQSQIAYDRTYKKSDLVYAICKEVGADTYLSGRGASMEYLDREKFAENHVRIVFQDFTPPVYPQCSSREFVPGISILDMLLNCGIQETKRLFWENVHSTHEFA